MRKKVDDETREIIISFIAEGYERLDDAEAQLGKLGDAEDRARLNAVFRLFHSVKGSAGYLGFDAIKTLTHEAEALLEVFLKEGVAPTPDRLDPIYGAIDTLRDLIGLVERDYSDEAGAGASAEGALRIAAAVEELRGGAGPKPSAASTQPKAEPRAEPPSSTAGDSASPAPGEADLGELVSREMVERFVAESADLIEGVERDALGLEGAEDKVEAVNGIFRAIHTIKGNAGFFGCSDLERACMGFETLLDGARLGKVPIGEGLVTAFMGRVDSIRESLGRVGTVLPGSADGPAIPPASDSSGAPGDAGEYRPIGQILVDMGAAKEEDIKEALVFQERPIGEILVAGGAVDEADVARALEIQKTQSSRADHPPAEEIQRKEIRVDTGKLDKLFDLVGELITAEAMVLNSPDLSGLKLDGFAKSFAGLSKISREIQETTMMIRMVPLESLFQKMSRLVRDLSRKSGKPVDFRVTGADTEMDKNVIEQISDPLVHIIRNAVDHGIEGAEDRALAGKPPAGVLMLDARYEGSEICISVRDDGGGLDRGRILEVAAQRGMVKPEASASLSDREVWQLIFEPGFSTAAKVTEVSGRGVGMDVVKKNIERIRGKVDIRTMEGEGTEFILKIPLTMAILEGITVRAGSGYYSIPLGDILEFFKVSASQLNSAEGGQITVALRGEVMPLVKLGEVFSIPGACLEPTEGILLVVQSGGRKACILIDEVVGNQQIVVKSLSEYLGRVDGLSGCSILGDGTVSFIIDTARLLSLRLETAAA